ncbi:MAG: carbohydrate kinase [Oscillospiraceae bacterium]|nr:carbohydrate kinase [Oscillospiraceae bacterium]
MAEVVALGELLVDFTLQQTDPEGYPVLAAHPGGAPANFLAALSHFGAATALLAKVGEDAFGTLLAQTLQKEGVDLRGLRRDGDAFTTLAFVTLDSAGERQFSFARKPGADTCLRPEELDRELISSAKVFHFGSLSLTHEPARGATREALALAKGAGCLITYDPNYRPPLWGSPEKAKEQMLWGLRQADVVKLSEEELEFLLGKTGPKAARSLMEEFGLKLVFVTLGERGCFFANGKCSGHVAALQAARVLDTTGAGDIFFGAAVSCLLRCAKSPEQLCEEDLRKIVTFAVIAAGLSTERAGGISSIPTLEEIYRRMEGI